MFKWLFKRSKPGKDTVPPDAEEAKAPIPLPPQDGPWIGVDLDGTLARHDMWIGTDHVGRPVEPMMNRVKTWLRQGINVKIVTARASVPEGIPPVEAWLKKQGLPPLQVTNQKDFQMIELWDDRAVQVIPNTGQPVRYQQQEEKES